MSNMLHLSRIRRCSIVFGATVASQVPSFEDDGRRREVWAAVEQLSPVELCTIRRVAVWRLRASQLSGGAREWEDVLHDAIVSIASGRRQWPEGINFFSLLIGAIRSLTDTRTATSAITPLSSIPEYRLATSVGLGPERVAMARDELAKIYMRFAGDKHALMLLDGWRAGLTGPEIQKSYGLSAQEFGSALKRISRKLAGEEHG